MLNGASRTITECQFVLVTIHGPEVTLLHFSWPVPACLDGRLVDGQHLTLQYAAILRLRNGFEQGNGFAGQLGKQASRNGDTRRR